MNFNLRNNEKILHIAILFRNSDLICIILISVTFAFFSVYSSIIDHVHKLCWIPMFLINNTAHI